jgi:hypothetical protein
MYTFKEILPEEVFGCFRISLMVNTWKEKVSDEEVERYIYSLLDTSDTHHSHDRKPMNTSPTFKPAA